MILITKRQYFSLPLKVRRLIRKSNSVINDSLTFRSLNKNRLNKLSRRIGSSFNNILKYQDMNKDSLKDTEINSILQKYKEELLSNVYKNIFKNWKRKV